MNVNALNGRSETKTSFFGKKKPDWDSAAFNYDEAGILFTHLQTPA